jgi:FlaA1/EpsC-like NDP-sugar epimerase
MGVTKRIAELLMQDLQNRGTKYVSVRFGNVLGSNGSVIPLFQRQIASGGPLRVTHRDMCRYFMTIPEAAQLVLQASSMGAGGEIFVLDMGSPVRIVDLARRLILLSGLRPDVDIGIEFTGVRPGEKLAEELQSAFEASIPTGHEKIRVFSGNGLPDRQSFTQVLNELGLACDDRDLGRLIITIKDLVPEYSPSSRLLREMMRPTRPVALATSA